MKFDFGESLLPEEFIYYPLPTYQDHQDLGSWGIGKKEQLYLDSSIFL